MHRYRLAAAIDGTAIGACFGSRCVAWRRTVGTTLRPATTASVAGAAITRTATPWTTLTTGPSLGPATHSLGDASFQLVGIEEAVLVGVDFVESALETIRRFVLRQLAIAVLVGRQDALDDRASIGATSTARATSFRATAVRTAWRRSAGATWWRWRRRWRRNGGWPSVGSAAISVSVTIWAGATTAAIVSAPFTAGRAGGSAPDASLQFIGVDEAIFVRVELIEHALQTLGRFLL